MTAHKRDGMNMDGAVLKRAGRRSNCANLNFVQAVSNMITAIKRVYILFLAQAIFYSFLFFRSEIYVCPVYVSTPTVLT